MSGSIVTATCLDGPWTGIRYTHVTRKPVTDRFNVVGAGGERVGSYTLSSGDGQDRAWRWGPWIEEPEKTICP